MSDPVKIALIVAIAPTLLAAGSFITSLRNRTKLDALHVDINSRLTELLKAREAEGHAAGVEQERNRK